jgi:hypothetical protein
MCDSFAKNKVKIEKRSGICLDKNIDWRASGKKE